MLCSVIICSQIVHAQAQTYRIGRLQLTNGTFVKGKKMTIGSSDITLIVQSQQVTYSKSDVVRAEYKRGWTLGWAAGCGLGCLGLTLVSVAASPDGVEDPNTGEPYTGGQIAISALFWAGVSAGIGALIGHFTDSYQTAYIKSDMSFLNNFSLQMYGFEKKQLGLTYNFSIPSF